MRLTITAKPNSRKNEVIVDPADPTRMTVHTTQPPENSKANRAIVKLVAGRLGIAPSRIALVSGQTSRTKILNIEE